MHENQFDEALATVRYADVISKDVKRRLVDRIETIRQHHCLLAGRCTECPSAAPCAGMLSDALGS